MAYRDERKRLAEISAVFERKIGGPKLEGISGEQRAVYGDWRRRCTEFAATVNEPGSLYAAMIDPESDFPQLRQDVARVLLGDFVVLETDSVQQAAEKYRRRAACTAVHATRLDVTTERTAIDGDRLRLDAWALTDFFGWVFGQMPNAKPKKFEKRLMSYFRNSIDFSSLSRAICNIVAPGALRPPQGDEGYFVAKARASNEDGFAELAKLLSPNSDG